MTLPDISALGLETSTLLAEKLVKALRDPDPAFKAVVNVVRQSSADIISNLITALSEARGREAGLRYALRRGGFRECDIPACNCGSWHAPDYNAREAAAREEEREVDAEWHDKQAFIADQNRISAKTDLDSEGWRRAMWAHKQSAAAIRSRSNHGMTA